MKKILFVAIFMLLATTVFSQSLQRRINTSEGEYMCHINYFGQNMGQDRANYLAPNPMYRAGKLSNGQWECVREMLSFFQTTSTM